MPRHTNVSKIVIIISQRQSQVRDGSRKRYNTDYLSGGFYSDDLGYVAQNCKKCPNGSYVPFDRAPGKSVLDCKACPQGKLSTKLPEATRVYPPFQNSWKIVQGPVQNEFLKISSA